MYRAWRSSTSLTGLGQTHGRCALRSHPNVLSCPALFDLARGRLWPPDWSAATGLKMGSLGSTWTQKCSFMRPSSYL